MTINHQTFMTAMDHEAFKLIRKSSKVIFVACVNIKMVDIYVNSIDVDMVIIF
jgi:hypothetical protein